MKKTQLKIAGKEKKPDLQIRHGDFEGFVCILLHLQKQVVQRLHHDAGLLVCTQHCVRFTRTCREYDQSRNCIDKS